MPPTMGAAIGFMTSEPMPDSQRIGTRLASTAHTVISFGRKRWTAPSIAAASMSPFVKVFPDLQFVFERFMEIDHHDDAGLDRNSEERDIADGHRNAEVVVKQPLQQQPSTHRIDSRKDEDERLGDRVEDHIQQQKNHEEDDRKNQLQPLLRAQFQFVLSRPLKGVIRRQRAVCREGACLRLGRSRRSRYS